MMVNKYAKMVETIMDDTFGFYIVNARNKSVFVFSDFKWLKIKSVYKVLERCFL